MRKIICLLLMVTLLFGGTTTAYACTPSFKAPNIPKIPNISASVQVPEVKIEDKYLPKVVFNKKLLADILVKMGR